MDAGLPPTLMSEDSVHALGLEPPLPTADGAERTEQDSADGRPRVLGIRYRLPGRGSLQTPVERINAIKVDPIKGQVEGPSVGRDAIVIMNEDEGDLLGAGD